MSILIIALPRTGSTELGRRLSVQTKLQYEFEPFNPLANLRYDETYKNKIVKTMVFHTPFFIKEEDRLNWLIEISKDFKQVILLSRKDLNACAESWSYLLYKTKKGFKSTHNYIWEKTPNYSEEHNNILKWNDELKFISNELSIPITYYEDIYDSTDKNRLRKGNRDDFNQNII
jgi:hypothetical protein